MPRARWQYAGGSGADAGEPRDQAGESRTRSGPKAHKLHRDTGKAPHENHVIVEDDPDQRENYRDAITKGATWCEPTDPRTEALAGFEQALPDLAILDIILGDEIDAGFELCRDLPPGAPACP